MIGKPSQVEAGKYDTAQMAVAVAELLGEVYHFFPIGRIDPVRSDGEPIVSDR
ncbi:MAG: hypothetical protein WA709_30855 [Stellaceae bacterium]